MKTWHSDVFNDCLPGNNKKAALGAAFVLDFFTLL